MSFSCRTQPPVMTGGGVLRRKRHYGHGIEVVRPWILPHFFAQISNGLPIAGVSKHAGVYFATRRTSVPSGVLFCKSFERALHSSVLFHKYFEHPYLLANQLNSNLYVSWPIEIQISKVGARVATGGEVLKPSFHTAVSGLLRSLPNLKFRQNLSTTIWKHE